MSLPNRNNSRNYGPLPHLPEGSGSLQSLIEDLYPVPEYLNRPLPQPITTTQSVPPLPQDPTNLVQGRYPSAFRELPTSSSEGNIDIPYPTTFRELPYDNAQQPGRRSLHDTLQGIDIDNKPWRAVTGLPKLHGISQHGDLENFLDYVNKNPNASQEDIQREMNKCTTQNCAENTFWGLTKMNARTKEGLSPRSELYRTKADSFSKKIESNPNFTPEHYPSYFDFPRALGINERNESLNANPETRIPRGTTVFMQNPRYNSQSNRNQEFPFDHVFYAEREGRNTSPIYRHLNAPPLGEPARGSITDNLQDIIDKGKYGKYRTIYSNKWLLPEAF